MRKLLPSLLALALIAPAVPAEALMIKAPPAALAKRADSVVRGRVVAVQSAWNEGHTTILTRVTVAVDEVWKGAVPLGQALALTLPGGEVGDTGIWVEDTPVFTPAEDVVLFLERDADGNAQVVAKAQGKFAIFGEWIVGCDQRPARLADFRAALALPVTAEGR